MQLFFSLLHQGLLIGDAFTRAGTGDDGLLRREGGSLEFDSEWVETDVFLFVSELVNTMTEVCCSVRSRLTD